jgi:hypothetical protein
MGTKDPSEEQVPADGVESTEMRPVQYRYAVGMVTARKLTRHLAIVLVNNAKLLLPMVLLLTRLFHFAERDVVSFI